MQCDSFSVAVLVAEVTQPSLGVGYEIGRAVDMKKKVLCLFRPQSGRRKFCPRKLCYSLVFRIVLCGSEHYTLCCLSCDVHAVSCEYVLPDHVMYMQWVLTSLVPRPPPSSRGENVFSTAARYNLGGGLGSRLGSHLVPYI